MKKRHSSHHTLYTTLFIILIGVSAFTYAQYTTPVPNPGHGATQVLVSINGTEVTLQQAIDQALLAGKAPGAPSIPNYTLDCLTSSTLTCPANYVETGDDPDNPARCCRILSSTPSGGSSSNGTENIVIGWDNNSNSNPDCWVISGSAFGSCGNPFLPPPTGGLTDDTQQGCVTAALAFYNSINIAGVIGGWNVQSWEDTGDASPCVDSSSDKLSVILNR